MFYIGLTIAMIAVTGILYFAWRDHRRDAGTFNDLTEKMRDILRGRK